MGALLADSATLRRLHLGLQNGLVGSPCSPRDSQESSPTPQFKSTGTGEPGGLMLVQSLGWEDALEKEMATHSSILAWETPGEGFQKVISTPGFTLGDAAWIFTSPSCMDPVTDFEAAT